MACVTDRNSKKHREFGLVEGEAPEPAISEETLLIKKLAQKQFAKETSLSEYKNIIFIIEKPTCKISFNF